jgi:hypothetical protein
MKKLQLTQNGKEIIATNGVLYVDGRFNIQSIKSEVLRRNERFKANFPHKLADGFIINNRYFLV